MTFVRNPVRLLVFLVAFLLGAGIIRSIYAQESPTVRAFSNAQQLYRKGKLAEALMAFQQYESENKFSTTLPQAIYFQACCQVDLHHYQEALDTFDRLLKAYPATTAIPEVILKQADCYRELNNYPKAIALYRQFETQYPQHVLLPQAMLGEGWILLQQHDLKAAREIAENARIQFVGDAATSLDSQFLLGQILIAEKNYDAADKIYKNIADNNSPRASQGFLLAGDALFDAKRYAAAIPYYERVQSSSDLRPAALFRIATCRRLLGQSDQAKTAYRQFLSAYPHDTLTEQVELALIQVLTERHETVEANTESQAFQKDYPQSSLAPDILLLQAESLFASAHFQEALDDFQKFTKISKNSQFLEAANFRIAACYYGLHNFPKARDGFSNFLNTYPNGPQEPEALFYLGRSYFEISRLQNDPAATQTNLIQAIKTYEQLHNEFPTSDPRSEVTFQLGYLYAYLNPPRGNKSSALFQEFANRWPDNPLIPEALYQIARNESIQSNPTSALTTYQQLVDEYPDHDLAPFAVQEMADIYRQTRNFSDAYTTLDHYAVQTNTNIRIAATISIIELALKENDTQRASAAAVKLLAAPEWDHLPSPGYVAVGQALLQQKQFSQAKDAFQKALALYPNDTQTAPPAQLGLGQADLGLKQLDEAEKAFDQVIATRPQEPAAEFGLAKVCLLRGTNSPASIQAVDLLSAVMAGSTGEDAGEIAFLLGNYFFNLPDNQPENKKAALAYYLRTTLLMGGPHSEEAAFRSGQCHATLGNNETARSAFQAYLHRFPNGRFAANAKEELASLSPPSP